MVAADAETRQAGFLGDEVETARLERQRQTCPTVLRLLRLSRSRADAETLNGDALMKRCASMQSLALCRASCCNHLHSRARV